MVEAVIDGFTVAMNVLARVWLRYIILRSTLSHTQYVIVMMSMHNGLVASAYIIKLVRSLQVHKDRSYLLCSLSRMSYVTLLNLEYVQ